jgi:hypothetical protein
MNSPWYTPGGPAGNTKYGGVQDWTQTPFVREFLDPEVPRGVYHSFLSNQGFGGLDRRSTWAQNQYQNTNTGYQSALRERPDLRYSDYLTSQFGGTGLGNIWAGLAPEQRGENPTRWSPNTRLIAWG